MGSAVFAVEQVGVDCDRSVTDVQEKNSLGREKKFLPLLSSIGTMC